MPSLRDSLPLTAYPGLTPWAIYVPPLRGSSVADDVRRREARSQTNDLRAVIPEKRFRTLNARLKTKPSWLCKSAAGAIPFHPELRYYSLIHSWSYFLIVTVHSLLTI